MGEGHVANTLEHDRYRRTVIRTIVAQEKTEGRYFPEDVMFVGDDWVYLARVRDFGSRARSPLPGSPLSFGQPFTIEQIDCYVLAEHKKIDQMLTDLYPTNEKVALILEGETRDAESRQLADVIERRPGFFKVRKGKQEVFVYKIRDAKHTIDETQKTPDGQQIGFTEFPS